MSKKNQAIFLSSILFEFMLLNLCALVVLFIKNNFFATYYLSSDHIHEILSLLFVFNTSWGSIILINGDSRFYTQPDFKRRLHYILVNSLIFLGIISMCAVLFKIEYFNRTSFLLPIVIFAFLDLFLFKEVVKYLQEKNAKSQQTNVLLIGGEKLNSVFSFKDKVQKLGYSIVGFIDEKNTSRGRMNGKFLGKMKHLTRVLDRNHVDEIFIANSSLSEQAIEGIIQEADFRGIRVKLLPETPSCSSIDFQSVGVMDGIPVLNHRSIPLDNINNLILKRIFDVFFSLSVLLFLSPFFLFIAFLIKLDSKGSIFYMPYRKGEGGKTFRVFKFRTMSECDDPMNGTRSTEKNDPRITRIGKYLRKFDLDELPQFLNVLIGDMSVIGPRPHRVNLQKDFRKCVAEYMVRHYVKPGISGWAQVNGWRGPTKTETQKVERIKHDIWYIENWKFTLDIKIIFLTVFSKKTRMNAF